MRAEMSGGRDDDKVTRSAQCLIQPGQLSVDQFTCYRDSPYISLLGPALVSANTLVTPPPILLSFYGGILFFQVLNDVTFLPNQWKEIIDFAMLRLQEKKPIWSEVCPVAD